MMSPRIYEIHALAWLTALSARYERTVTLASVPPAEIDAIAELGVDAVWLMGVWERSPAGRRVATELADLQVEYERALPDLKPADVAGSPYAIKQYSVEPRLGGPFQLAALRRRLAERGLMLILDFVPNHTALDHRWLSEAADLYVLGTEEDILARPGHFFRTPEGHIVAHGKDPYFPPWTDTAQVNALSPALRERARDKLLRIASQCDGVRCDMAMLMNNSVFKHTWGDRAGQAPEEEYWQAVLPEVKAAYPGFLVMAEVYWDMEWEMMRLGFDLAYDKRLYDRMRGGSVHAILGHLAAEIAYQKRLVRFIENHDEPRAIVEFGGARSQAAAALFLTLPGAKLVHEGQQLGHRVKLPVQLGRRPNEADDPELCALYRRLLGEVSQPVFQQGEYSLREAAPTHRGSTAHRALISYSYRLGDERRLVVVNWSGESAAARIPLPDMALAGASWILRDAMNGQEYEREGDEMARVGLFVLLGPWSAHVFAVSRSVT